MDEYNRLLDANVLYDGGTKAIAGSPFKYGTQSFEMNHLLETAKLQKDCGMEPIDLREDAKDQSVNEVTEGTSPATR